MISYLIIAVLEFLISITGTLGNILTCRAVFKNHRLHNAACFFVVSLAVADLLTCSVLVLMRGVQHIGEFTGKSLFSNLGISVIAFSGRITLLVSFIHLAVLSLDRAVAVSFPFFYRIHLRHNQKGIVAILLFVWGISVVFTVVVIVVVGPGPIV